MAVRVAQIISAESRSCRRPNNPRARAQMSAMGFDGASAGVFDLARFKAARDNEVLRLNKVRQQACS